MSAIAANASGNPLSIAALSYARQDRRVFPCHPQGKRPLTSNGFHAATIDSDQIRQWWIEHPTANIGLNTAGLIVIDVDGEKGAQSLAVWQEDHGVLPKTATARTGGGGRHYVFEATKHTKCRIAVLEGVDIRADGGYIIVPPSVHQSGQPYQWVVSLSEIAEASDLVYQLAEYKTAKAPGCSRIPEGERNSTLFTEACTLQAMGSSDDQMRSAIGKSNVAKCVVPLEVEEAQRIVDGVTARYPKGELAGDYTTAGLAQRFTDRYREKARYCSELGWLVYSGIVWERNELEALRLMDAFTQDMLRDENIRLKEAHDKLAEAEILNDTDEIKEAKSKLKASKERCAYVRRCRSASSLKSTLAHAKCLLEIKVDQLDQDPYALNTPDGLVDLYTGEVHPHNPADFCTKVTAETPAESSTDSQLSEFLSLIFCGDEELIYYAQVTLGSAIIGKVYEEALIVAYGGGSNGKSTLFNSIAAVIGSYSGKISAVALTTKGGNVKNDLAELMGVRLCLAAETEEGMRMSNSMLKQIASTDKISAERKFRDPFSFEPSHLVVLFTNYLPKVPSRDIGTWRRLKVLPFNAEITNPDTSFAEKLLRESGKALLRWLIEGAQAFIANGRRFPSCEAVRHASADYKASNDWLKDFLDECCIVGEGSVGAGELYTRYCQWAADTNNYSRSKADFKAALEGEGYKHGRTNAGARWRGISLTSSQTFSNR